MRNETTYQLFKEFVKEQDEERPIHQGSRWCECAVGDFAVERLEMTRQEVSLRFVDRVLGEDTDLRATLDHHGRVTRNGQHTDEDTIKTYGQLKEYINSLEG